MICDALFKPNHYKLQAAYKHLETLNSIAFRSRDKLNEEVLHKRIEQQQAYIERLFKQKNY